MPHWSRAPRLVLLALALGMPTVSGAQSAAMAGRDPGPPPIVYPGGVEGLRGVTYAEPDGFRPLTMDLYLPRRATARRPLIVVVHGGAWRHRTAREGGTFRNFPAILAEVAARGYVVASVDYRLSGEATFPGPVQDVTRAIAWLRGHAAAYDLDPDRVILWGSSAGGQIATLIGTACGAPLIRPAPLPGDPSPMPSTCVQGVIDWYGVTDLERMAGDLAPRPDPVAAAVDSYLGCALATCPPGLARSASPLAYVDPKDPPFLIQHGEADVTVSPKQSQRLYDALRKAGVPAELIFYPKVSHGFAKVPGGGPDDTVNRAALDAVTAWLARHFPVKGS